MAKLRAPLWRQNQLIDVMLPFGLALRHWLPFRRFLGRAIARRYRLNAFGFLWMLFAPLFTLGIYLFVFGVILESRWVESDAGGTVAYGLNLFAGLIVFWLMADVLNGASGAVTEYTNVVKNAVFPVDILPIVVVGSGVFHTLISALVLVAATLALVGSVPPSSLLLPVVLAPFVLLLMGLAWLLAGIGVYLRDLAQVVGLAMTGGLFLSPILYPIDGLSTGLQRLIALNPVTVIVEQTRRVMLDGTTPEWGALSLYLIIAWIVAALGLAAFRHLRGGFGDVL